MKFIDDETLEALEKLTVLDPEDQFNCSLNSDYPYRLIKDVIKETCQRQLAHTKTQLGLDSAKPGKEK